MKFIAITVLLAGACVAIPASSSGGGSHRSGGLVGGLVCGVLDTVGDVTTQVGGILGFVQAMGSLSCLTQRLRDEASAVNGLTVAVTQDPNDAFCAASASIAYLQRVNTGLDDVADALCGLISAINSLDQSKGRGDSSKLLDDINDINCALDNTSAAISVLIGTTKRLTFDLYYCITNIPSDLNTLLRNLDQIAQAIQNLSKTLLCFAEDEGNTYAPWFRLAIQMSGISDGLDCIAQAVAYLQQAIAGKVGDSGPPGSGALADMKEELGDVSEGLSGTSDALSNLR